MPSDGVTIRYSPWIEVAFHSSNDNNIARVVRFEQVNESDSLDTLNDCNDLKVRLFSIFPFQLSGMFHVKYQVQYDLFLSVNAATGQESSHEPRWARVFFDATCAHCGSTAQHSKQSDIIRPSPVSCPCGATLYEVSAEMPLLRCYIGDPS